MTHLKTHWQRRTAVFALLLAGTFGGYLVVNADTQQYNDQKIYMLPGTRVVYSECADSSAKTTCKVGVFENSWYLAAGNKPKFYPNGDGWKQIGATVYVDNLMDALGTKTPPGNKGAAEWITEAIYTGGNIVLGSDSSCTEPNGGQKAKTRPHNWPYGARQYNAQPSLRQRILTTLG